MSPSYFAEEQSISLFHPPPRQINSSAQYWGIKPDWNLLGVRMWSPLIEEHGNKTLTWNRLWSPQAKENAGGNLIRALFFSRLLPLHNVELEEPKFKDSGEKETKGSSNLEKQRHRDARVCLGDTETDAFWGKEKKMLQSCKFPTARRSKKQESAQTSNISHSQVEERKLLHTNLMQTETEPSWDNGRGGGNLHKIKIESFKHV